MTDYHYQATARDEPPEDEGEVPFAEADPRRSAYPPEDEAYWAEAGAPSADEGPLWYEDRVGLAEPTRTKSAPVAPELEPTPHHLPDGHWTEPEAAGPAAGGPEDAEGYWTREAAQDSGSETWPVAWTDETDTAEATRRRRVSPVARTGRPDREQGGTAYVPGASAAAGLAAAEAGRRIRFDPTMERGAAYYESAARHSRRVRLLKIVLPTAAVIAVAGFFVVLSFVPDLDDGLPALTLSGINVESRQITMDKPHISGFAGTKRAYEVHAVKAMQDLTNPKVVMLEQIVARFAIGDDVRANIEAASGTYDGGTQKMTLKGGISLTTTNGYAAQLEDAAIDVEKGTVASDTGVVIKGKEGTLTADSFEVLDRGKHIFFRGDVKILYHPPEKEDVPGTGAGEETPTAATPAPMEPAPDGST
ncbi:MAG TPA: hypothetical protein VFK86_17265 [Bauldia sp.]|nr:hypothetical protein [Bauldia sp.]